MCAALAVAWTRQHRAEIRLSAADGERRFAFAFDPKRQAVILIGGDKLGIAKDRFYRPLIKRADKRISQWIEEE